MNIPDESLRSCFSKLTLVNETYRLNYVSFGQVLKSLDDLMDICSSHLDKNIIFREHKARFHDHAIRGFYLSLGISYEIVLVGGQNLCWQRFITAKEIFQVLLDEISQRSTNLGSLIDEVTLNFHLIDHQVTPKAETEVLAEICAAEFLFPYTKRQHLLNSGKELNFLQIAEEIKIPQLIVEQFLSVSYMEVLNPESYRNP